MAAKYPKDLASHVHAQLRRRKEKPPDVSILTELFEVMYFASLTREENEAISCRVAFINREAPDPFPPQRITLDRWQYFVFREDLEFTVPNVTKLSKAADPWGSTLAVDCDNDKGLRIWGLIDQSVHYSTFVMKEASVGPEMPGLFQALIQGVGDIAAYKTYVWLGGLRHGNLTTTQSRVFEEGPVHARLAQFVRQYQRMVRDRVSKKEYKGREHWPISLEDQWITSVCRLLIGIKRYGHGGAVLISDEGADLKPKYHLRYPRLIEALVSLGAATIRETYLRDQIWAQYAEASKPEMPTKLHRDYSRLNWEVEEATNQVTGCIRFLTSLSRVDGLIWLDSRLHLQGFGVEIKSAQDPAHLLRADAASAKRTSALSPEHFGMRHRSMMRYCGINQNSVGFVVSQDGNVRAIMSFGNRVVLWENVRLQRILITRSRASQKKSA